VNLKAVLHLQVEVKNELGKLGVKSVGFCILTCGPEKGEGFKVGVLRRKPRAIRPVALGRRLQQYF
jgi:hypothetical protein